MADETTVYGWLAADATLAALVSTRIWDQRVPENLPSPHPVPYIIGTVVSIVPENQLQGRPGVDRYHFQFDVYAETKASARAVLAAMRTPLELEGYEISSRDFADPTTDLRNIKSDWEFWLPR